MKTKYKILIVDDTEYNRSLLADILSEEYEIFEAENGEEAVSILNKHHSEIQLILLDLVMPKMDGFEVLAFLNKSNWIDEIPVITISAETSSLYIEHAYDLGATEYISRPFDEKTIKRRVKNIIMLYAKQKMLENMVTDQILEREKSNLLMVDILSNIVEFRNGESGLHVLHIRIITEELLKALVRKTSAYQLSPAKIALIVNASALHDVGKISISESILNKPGKLTAEEFEIMKTHSAIGAQILSNAPMHQSEELVRVAADICRWHHERYDGKGYPDGLKGEEIPISAQVVSLADVYDALTSVRVYKEAYSHEKAMNMIRNGECGAFHPMLMECLEEIGPMLSEKLKIRSQNTTTRLEAQQLTNELLHGNKVSNRTLSLLEQERVKYQFFASMSKEVQFEYSYQTGILNMSEWGADLFGLPEFIKEPEFDKSLNKVFSQEDYVDLKHKLRAATPRDPIVTAGYFLNVNGEKRWYKAVARPLWADYDDGEIIGVIGKFVDEHAEHFRLISLEKKSERDSLTELLNHEAIRKIAENLLRDPQKGNYAFFLLDVDFFKIINDNYGHLFGDKILRRIATVISENLDSRSFAARVGGDEFLICFCYDDNIEEKTRAFFQAVASEYEGVLLSISMGVAIVTKDSASYDEIFHRADQALYFAKKHGKNKYEFYKDSMKGLLSILSPMDH